MIIGLDVVFDKFDIPGDGPVGLASVVSQFLDDERYDLNEIFEVHFFLFSDLRKFIKSICNTFYVVSFAMVVLISHGQ